MAKEKQTTSERLESLFQEVVETRENAEKLERKSVKLAVQEGWSWARIAKQLGVSRQAVHKKYAKDYKKKK